MLSIGQCFFCRVRGKLALCIIFLLVLAFCNVGIYAKNTDTIPKQRSISSVLSLRCQMPKMNYISPRSGMVSVSNGSTIVISGNQALGASSFVSASSIIGGIELRGSLNLELRVMGRTIYFNQEVESVELVDMTGRKILVQHNVRHTSLANIRSGIYVLKCTCAGNVVSNRIVLR